MFLSRHNARELTPINHLRQSVVDILTTPIGSRVGRRDYGSRLFDLIDSPASDTLSIDIAAATSDALRRWEPRLGVRRIISRAADASGVFEIDIEAEFEGRSIVIDGVLV